MVINDLKDLFANFRFILIEKVLFACDLALNLFDFFPGFYSSIVC